MHGVYIYIIGNYAWYKGKGGIKLKAGLLCKVYLVAASCMHAPTCAQDALDTCSVQLQLAPQVCMVFFQATSSY